ncbi:shikimate kinase [Thermohalobaculum xanthum]|uniref:shikimate kinase n=1 Tax=Thermohalobaculum xanthum TaxID=2753746 RepID=UPI002D7ECC4C|nr:shikimate kinase [Thermohalobaculum xanthum]
MAKQARTASVEGPTLRRPIVLIGLMGAGKSSVGQRLAERLGVPFADSDAEIERAAAMSIAEIFERYGEPHFRDGERRVIARLLQEPPMVLATGGGAFMNPETRALIAQGATSVWLKAGLDLLVSRTAGRTHRPLLNRGNPRETLARLIRDRYPVYAEAAVTVESEAGFTHDEMASRIIAALEAHGAFLPAPRDE